MDLIEALRRSYSVTTQVVQKPVRRPPLAISQPPQPPRPPVGLPMPVARTKLPPLYKMPSVTGVPPKISLISIVDRYLHSLNETPPDFYEVRIPLNRPRTKKAALHPSGFCKEDVCKRHLIYEMFEAPVNSGQIDARLRRIFDTGHFFHARIEDTIERAVKYVGGLYVPGIQLRMELHTNPFRITGTPDCGFIINGWPYIVEQKSMNKRLFAELGALPWPEHRDQLLTYMWMNNVKAGFVFIECKDNQEIREYFVTLDTDNVNRLQNLVLEVNEFYDRRELPPKITKEQGCLGKDCAHYNICKGQMTWSIPDADHSTT